jgi:putative FmdB family regulatory protein
MPIYEYQCDECDHLFEKIQKMSDDPLKECPSCGKMSLRKLISASGFRLKGSGWYETDFKTDGKKNIADSDTAKGGKSSPKKAAASAKTAEKKTGSKKKAAKKTAAKKTAAKKTSKKAAKKTAKKATKKAAKKTAKKKK